MFVCRCFEVITNLPSLLTVKQNSFSAISSSSTQSHTSLIEKQQRVLALTTKVYQELSLKNKEHIETLDNSFELVKNEHYSKIKAVKEETEERFQIELDKKDTLLNLKEKELQDLSIQVIT